MIRRTHRSTRPATLCPDTTFVRSKLGFQRVPIFVLKRKNVINEPLFTGPPPEEDLNVYARILVDEARRRGIAVEVLDAEGGFFRLTHGGRSISCRESLSQLTDAVAMSRCDDRSEEHTSELQSLMRITTAV